MQNINDTETITADILCAALHKLNITGLRVVALNTVASTNTLAKEMAGDGIPTLIVANGQTGGRGRLGRSFACPDGAGVYMSLLIYPDMPAAEVSRLTCLAAVAAARAVTAVSGITPFIKWVNDLYLDGCKVGGILTEAVTRADGTHRMIVGLGINLSTAEFPEGLRAPAASLFSPDKAHAVTPALMGALAGEITRRLLDMAHPAPEGEFPGGMWGEACLDFYRRWLLHVGEAVVCTRGSDCFEGLVTGVDGDFSLLVDSDGRRLTLSSGEISVRPVKKS